jgi:phosphomannomutase
MSQLIISVSGLRGIVGETLTPEIAARYTRAFLAELPPGPIVVTQDGRQSGSMLATAIAAAVAAAGRTCLCGGVAATPTTGVLVRTNEASGGIQISASHNPAEYNGMKLFSAQGRILPSGEGQKVLDQYHPSRGSPAATDPPPESIKAIEETISAHANMVLATVDVAAIQARRFRVLLDSNHGAGSLLGRYLLEQLHCEVTLLGDHPDGRFAHLPEPTEANLAGVLALVRDAVADVGFCQDPDADRLAVVDHRGRYLGEEYTLAMSADHVLAQRPGPIVTNCSTSRMTEDVAARHGVPFYRSAVGEANVVDTMLAHGAVFGGEGNGGVIDPRVGLVRDSFVGMALLLSAMATGNCTVADLADRLPRYAIHKTKVDLAPAKVAAGLTRLAAHFQSARGDQLDGLRLDWPDRWLLVRPSNTEPIVRVIAEARTLREARSLCDDASEVLRGQRNAGVVARR